MMTNRIRHPPYDVRLVANQILDSCAISGIKLTNLSLQKVVFLIHQDFLVETGSPLIQDEFEAWQYGPVHRVLYQAFSSNGANYISNRALTFDRTTRQWINIDMSIAPDTLTRILDSARFYAGMPTFLLIDLTHERGSAWERVWSQASGKINIGMKIPNELILSLAEHRRTT